MLILTGGLIETDLTKKKYFCNVFFLCEIMYYLNTSAAEHHEMLTLLTFYQVRLYWKEKLLPLLVDVV